MSCFGFSARSCGLTLGVAAALTGCGISASHDTATATATAPPSSAGNPAAAAAAASQALAVVVTNSTRQGDSYTVDIISDGTGETVASATAHLPSLKLHSDLDLPLVSVSATRAYFLDGDTKVRSLAPDGTSQDVTTIPEGDVGNVTFAVSPDDKRVAIGDISEGIDDSQTTGVTWVEDLHGATNRVQLFSFSGQDAYRWPVGWEGGRLIVALRATLGCGGYSAPGGGGGGGVGGGGGGGAGGGGVGPATAFVHYNCPGAYHIVDATTGAHLLDVCQSAPTIRTGFDDLIPVGPLTRDGVACLDYAGGYGIARWDGSHTVLAVLPNEHSFSCGASLDATQLACSGSTGTFVSPSVLITSTSAEVRTVSLGHRYSILGWMDNDCMLVTIDRDHLGIVAAAQNGMHLSIPFTNADQVTLVGTLPG